MDNVVSKLIESIKRAYAKLAENGYDTGKEMITLSHDSIWSLVNAIEEMEKQLEESQKSYESACDVSSDYYHEIRELEATQLKWISVYEHRPNRKGFVLNEYGDIGFGHIVMSTVGYCCEQYGGETIFNVTHWMPLPEPPEEVE